MILSHRFRYIFLHCRKAAGSSATAYLNRYLGPDDLQVGTWADSIKFGGKYNRKLILDLVSWKGVRALAQHSAIRLAKGRIPKGPDLINSAHKDLYRGVLGDKPEQPLASEVKQFAPTEWETYFKFCFVRNPFDRAVSDYRWRTRGKPDISFLEFLERVADPARPDPEHIVPNPRSNWPIYTIDDQIAVDFVGRFERFADDLAHVCNTLSIPFDAASIPFAKKSSGTDRGYRDWYGEREKVLVARLFAHEIDQFGYTF